MQLSVIVATLQGCPFAKLDDPSFIGELIDAAVEAGGFTKLHHYVHQFSPQGVTGAAVLAESHINIHTWPEEGSMFVDLATCSGEQATRAAFEKICELMPHIRVEPREILLDQQPSPLRIPA